MTADRTPPPAAETPPQRLGRLKSEGATYADAIALFDACAPVAVAELTGPWVGSELTTGHPLDGLLDRYGWHGKRFDGPDDVYPLVFADALGRFTVDPAGLPVRLLAAPPAFTRDPRIAGAVRRLLRLRATTRPAARLRTVTYRGTPSAAMAYDALPIDDHFRRIDEDTVLGAMDLRGAPREYFFVLRREGLGHDDPGSA